MASSPSSSQSQSPSHITESAENRPSNEDDEDNKELNLKYGAEQIMQIMVIILHVIVEFRVFKLLPW